MEIFKAYDIRGEYPAELDEAMAEKIGMAAGRFFPGRTIAVGRDMRVSGPALAEALLRGLTRAGKYVVDLGLVTTPMVTFAVARFDYDAGIMVTASHNPAKYNGMKFVGKGAEAISYDSGINEIERMVTSGDLRAGERPGPGPSAVEGSVSRRDVLPEYLGHVMAFAGPVRGLKLAIDAGNGMAGYLMPHLFGRIEAEVVPLFFELDGRFPNHEANPLKPENLVPLQKKVQEVHADLGVAFDGDGDRVAFVDERGAAIPCDITTGLIARDMLESHPGAAILYDVRSSWAIREDIAAFGGIPVLTRVGHSFIKQTMRERDAVFGGELSGHYYFRDNFYSDSGAFTVLRVLSILCRERRPLSELVAPIQRYHHSGEVNSEVDDKLGKIEELARAYGQGRVSRLDGLTVEFDDWWFNVRPSNTEPEMRLVVEATTSRAHMEIRRDTLARQIRRGFAVRKVLFTTDFSPYSKEALPHAVGMARDHGAELHVLHVLSTPELGVQFETMALALNGELLAQIEKASREELEKVVSEEVRKELPVTLALRRGAAFVEILRYAREVGIDLIVLATHGRTGLSHALFGSVAEKVVRKAPCPVLSVRPKGHEFKMP